MEKIRPLESIISSRYQRTSSKDVWRKNLQCAFFASDKVRSTLGPKGSYKLVSYNRGPEQVVKITKDAIAILDELALQYPPAVIVSEAAKMQRQEAGDGATTFVVLLSALLRRADELLAAKIHANTIIHGYSMATERALQILEAHAASLKPNSDILNTIDCQRNLLTPHIRILIRKAFQNCYSNGRFNRECIRFIKKSGGNLDDTSLINGVVLDKQKAHPNMPDNISNPLIAITSQRLGINRLEVKMPSEGPLHFNLKLTKPEQIQAYKEVEYKLKSRPIQKLVNLGVNILLCQQPIDDYQKSELNGKGIFALENVDQKDLLLLEKATEAKTVGNLNDLTADDLGKAGELSVGKIELIKTVTISGCKGATFLLRGNTVQSIEELETAINNSMVLLKLMQDDSRILPGGGAIETQLAHDLKAYSLEFKGKEQIAIQAYAEALLEIPRCLAGNCGLNAIDALVELKNRHSENQANFGVSQLGCRDWVCEEPLKVKRSVLRRALEASTLMLKVDELIISKEIPKFHKQ